MAKQITYREQEKIQNTMKLREFLSELPPYAKVIFVQKNRRHLIKPVYLMRMIYEFSFDFFKKVIRT